LIHYYRKFFLFDFTIKYTCYIKSQLIIRRIVYLTEVSGNNYTKMKKMSLNLSGEFKGKNILITGGTGSIGMGLAKQLIKYNPNRGHFKYVDFAVVQNFCYV